jgi:hypothetical protein
MLRRPHNGHALAVNVALDFDDLPFVGIRDGGDTSLSAAHIADLKRFRAINHAEAIREMDKLGQVAVDRGREDRFHDSLPMHR